jgi:hypothetical protein
VSSSRFVAPSASRFIKAEKAVSRFIHHSLGVDAFFVRHPKLSRFIAHIPCVSKFFMLPPVASVSHVTPVYNSRARKRRPPMLRM